MNLSDPQRAMPEAPHPPTLRRVVNGPLQSNTYLLAAPGTGWAGSDCVVVDPGLDPAALDDVLRTTAWLPQAVLCTHGHFDHVGGAAALQQRWKIPVYLHTADAKLARMANFLLAAFKRPERIALPEFTLLQGAAARVDVAGRAFTFHTLPGHSAGSCGIAADGLMFTGDTLYARHTGLSKLPGEDHVLLRATLRGLFAWVDGAVLVLPGHGGSAMVAEILAGNTALHAFMAADRLHESPAAAAPCPMSP